MCYSDSAKTCLDLEHVLFCFCTVEFHPWHPTQPVFHSHMKQRCLLKLLLHTEIASEEAGHDHKTNNTTHQTCDFERLLAAEVLPAGLGFIRLMIIPTSRSCKSAQQRISLALGQHRSLQQVPWLTLPAALFCC